MKAETGENLSDLRFERVPVTGHKFVFEPLIPVGDIGYSALSWSSSDMLRVSASISFSMA